MEFTDPVHIVLDH